jgi:putative membrane protein|tara:strand:- start:90 stop:521 length:432 start_codon:yes stop_codon:yes gene_type:complete
MGIELFLWIKIIHILAVISWMAGLLYLPRLFVYHSENSKDSLLNDTFKVMEHKLFRFIMSPAMMVVWVSGLILFYNSGFQLWLILKFLLVILMTLFHIFLKKCITGFNEGTNKFSSNFFRFINEIPTILMIFIVILVVLKPWS